MENNIGKNIKKLRELRGLTQEQLARELNLSYQAVSKWETGATVPDTLTLPSVASALDVTIDDLFKPQVDAYDNNAQRLLAVYEASHDRNDFIRADAEFRKLFDSGKYTRDDVRSYGVLNEYQMYDCRDLALKQYESLLSGSERDMAYKSARQQRLYMLSRIGRGEEAVKEERARVQAEPDDPDCRLTLMAALHYAGRYEEALAVFEEARERFGELDGVFTIYAGDACRALGRFDEAFAHWERATELCPEAADPLFSMAFCLDEQGKYAEAAEAWQRVIDWLTARGYVHELSLPKNQLRRAREHSTTG